MVSSELAACEAGKLPQLVILAMSSFGTKRKSRNGEVISEAGGTPAAPSADRPQPPLTQSSHLPMSGFRRRRLFGNPNAKTILALVKCFDVSATAANIPRLDRTNYNVVHGGVGLLHRQRT